MRNIKLLLGSLLLSLLSTSQIVSQSINITSPSGGTEWTEGNTYTISWTKSFSDNVRIEVWDDDDSYVVKTIASSIGGTSMSYTVPYDFNSPDYILRISRVSNPSTNDDLDFEMINVTRSISLSGNLSFGSQSDSNLPTTRTLTISNSSSSNRTLTVSSISYPAGFSGNWSGTIAVGASRNVTVTYNPSAAGSHSGNVVVNSNKSSGTNTRSISGTATTSINLTAPTSVVTWKEGTSHTISWSKSPLFPGNVKVELLNANYSFNRTISSNHSGTSLNWTVPGGLEGDYVIRVTGLSNNQYDQQDVELIEIKRIISLSGNLSFGSVSDNSLPATRTLTITNSNSSTDPISVSSITYPSGFSGNWSGTIAKGASKNVTVTYDPSSAGTHSGNLTVNSNKTSGTNTRSVSGTATTSLNLAAPGASNWIVGDTETISWTRSPLETSNVRLDLYSESGTLLTQIASSVFGNSYNWNVSSGYNGDRVIRVTSLATNAQDNEDIELVPVTRTISLSGNLAFGSVSDSNLPQTATLAIQASAANNKNLSVSGINYPTGFSGQNWSGTLTPGQNKQITVSFDPSSSGSHSGNISVSSNKISGSSTRSASGTATTSISLTAPTSVVSWKEGTSHTISWSKSPLFPGNVKVELLNANYSFNRTISSSHSGTSMNWTVPGGLEGDYVIRVTGLSNGQYDQQDVELYEVKRIISLSGNLSFGSISDSSLPSTRTLTITNSSASTDPLSVSSISYPSGFSGNWSGSISPGNTRNVTVTYDPSSAGTHSGSLAVNSNKTSGTNTRSVSGTATTSISLTAPTVVVTWKEGTSQTISWSKSPLFPGNVKVELLNANYSFNRTISSSHSGSSLNWTVPGGLEGDYVIRVTGLSNSQYDQQDVELITVKRIISLSGNLTFGSMSDSSLPSTRTLTISNTSSSTDPLNVSSITYPSGFSGNWSGSIAVGASQNVTVTYDPSTAGTHSGNLTVNSNKTSGTNTRSVSGTATTSISLTAPAGMVTWKEGTSHTISWSKSPLFPGNVKVELLNDNYSFNQTIAANHSGTSLSWTVPGGLEGDYVIRVTGLSNNQYDQQDVELITVKRIIYLSGDLAFGSIVDTSLPSTRTLTISNTGSSTDPITVSSITYPSGFSGDWTGTLDPNESQNVTVTFDPASAGTHSGSLTVNSNRTSGTHTRSVSGTATTSLYLSAPPSSIWIVGDTETISWTRSPLETSNVKIELYSESGTFLTQIAASAAGNSYDWTVDSGWNGDRVIRITSLATSVEDNEDIELVPVDRTISLSGDLAFGSVSDTNLPQTATLTIQAPLDNNKNLSVTGISYPNGFSGENWTGTLTPGQNRQVTVSFDPASAGSHSGNISISANNTSGANTRPVSGTTTTSMNLTSPSGLATWVREETKTITWTKSPFETSTVDIDFVSSDGSTVIYSIATGVTGTSYNWTIPAGTNYTTGRLRIRSQSTTAEDSEPIDIEPIEREIVLQGDFSFGLVDDISLPRTDTLTILALSDNNTDLVVSSISYPTGATGENWSGSVAPGQSKKIAVTFDATMCGYQSGTISVAANQTEGSSNKPISADVQTSIAITSPAHQAIFNEGTEITVSWNKGICTNNVKVELLNYNHQLTETLTSSTAATSINWTIGLHNESDVIVRVTSLDDPTVFDEVDVETTRYLNRPMEPIDFGVVMPEELPDTRTLTLVNNTASSEEITSIFFPTAYSGDWSGGTIPAQSSQVINITFNPGDTNVLHNDPIVLYTSTFPLGMPISISGIHKIWDMWLTSPNGGEAFGAADDLPIALDASIRYPASLTIELYKGATLVHSQAGPSGSSIALGDLAINSGGDFKVHIFDTSDPTKEDWSDLTFTLDDRNLTYVITKTARVPFTNTIDGIDANEVAQATIFYDGLGRPMEEVVKHGGAIGSDLVTPIVYDAAGRKPRQYLPIPVPDNNGFYHAHDVAMTDLVTSYSGRYGSNDGNYAYAETRFEASPMNRVLEQSAPGFAWRMGAATMTHAYDFAPAGEVIEWNTETLLTDAKNTYPAGMLYKNVITDEDGHRTVGYMNKEGQMVLKKAFVNASDSAETYYLYDSYGNLAVTLPPEATAKLDQEFFLPGSDRAAFLNTWAFLYGYDDLNRMTMKKVPGADSVFMVYDQWDRLVLTQDGNLRTTNSWLFTKYDALNRPIMTGRATIPGDLASVRTAVDASTNRYDSPNQTLTHQYSNQSYPTTGVDEVLTVLYYDNYDYLTHADWSSLGLGFNDPESVLTYSTAVKGQATGAITRTGEGSWIRSTSFYDDRYRLIQARSTNHLNGTEAITNYYDFIGQVNSSIAEHNNGDSTITITRSFTYDHIGRLLQTWHRINDEDSVLIAEHTYDNLGRLSEKDLHVYPLGGGSEQSLDYTYNIRGWLTHMNDSDVSGSTDGDLFGMELLYNDQDPNLSNQQLYNGNISAMKWTDQSGGPNAIRAYSFSYDSLNRLKTADHFENDTPVNNYGVAGLNYDLNGNISQLIRNGSSGAAIDSLLYDYSGNQLQWVNDVTGNALGFDNKATGANIDYAYDANGNMAKDLNKGIDTIYYNHLNLPVTVILSDSQGSQDSITYLYDAAGVKLQQVVYEAGDTLKVTDYLGEFIYETDTLGQRNLQLIHHEEGRIVPVIPVPGTGISGYDYQYHLKDHLGNVRLTFSTEPENYEIVEDFEDVSDSYFEDLAGVESDQNRNTTTPYGAGKSKFLQLSSGETGAMIFLGMNKGDTIHLSVEAHYVNDPSSNTFLPTAYTALFSSFDAVYGSGAEGGVSSSSSAFNDAVNGAQMADKNNGGLAPRAYVNFIFFDRDMNYETAGFTQISTDAKATGPNQFELITREFVADQEGYILAYLSNENSEAVNVNFDDFTVYQGKTNVVQTDDYYPFGLTFNSISRTASTPQNFLLAGNERLPEWGAGMYDFNARMYDASIGRFGAVDPLADYMQESWNPYHYNYNNPLRFTDPTGLNPCETEECKERKAKERERKADVQSSIIESDVNDVWELDITLNDNGSGTVNYVKNGKVVATFNVAASDSASGESSDQSNGGNSNTSNTPWHEPMLPKTLVDKSAGALSHPVTGLGMQLGDDALRYIGMGKAIPGINITANAAGTYVMVNDLTNSELSPELKAYRAASNGIPLALSVGSMAGLFGSGAGEAAVVIGVVGWAGEQVYNYYHDTIIPFFSNSLSSSGGSISVPFRR